MRKTITVNYLRKLDACPEAIKSFQAQEERDTIKLLRKYLQLGYFNWVNWLIVRLMDRKQRIKYAVYAAEMVLPAWEERYPNDKRPHEAIQAAKKVLERDSRENREAARAAAAATAAADAATYTTAHAAYAVAYAAYVARAVDQEVYMAARTAARAAACAADAAANAAADVAAAANAVADVMTGAEAKIIEYGIALLQKGA